MASVVPRNTSCCSTVTVSQTTSLQVLSYDGDPNSNVLATGVAICIGTGASAGTMWVKTTSGTSSTDWLQVIA